MPDPIEAGARAAARRLAVPARPELAEEVEAALYGRGAGLPAERRPARYGDPTAVGSLVVSVATLAWTVHNDLKSRGAAAPPPEAVARRVRQRLDQADTPEPSLDPGERDRIIDVTVEETLDAVPDEREPRQP